jgi:hypothetical protein
MTDYHHRGDMQLLVQAMASLFSALGDTTLVEVTLPYLVELIIPVLERRGIVKPNLLIQRTN